MPLTEVQLAKLTIKINQLTTEADRLETEARRKDADFLAAWQIYGSELAGSPETSHLYNKATKYRKLAYFLSEVKEGKILLSNRGIHKERMRYVTHQIDEYTKQKEEIEATLSNFEYLQEVLSN